VELADSNDTLLASRATSLPSHDASGNAIRQTVAHVYDHYSAEGLHMVEHVLLRPRAAGESVLSIPIDETDKIRDPYSHRVSIVLPSGYSRDFSEDPLAAVRNDVAPHRFRDREFRRHAARMIRQACPAHLLPGIYWVDRQAAGTPDDPGSFDQFELRYFAWLDTILIPGVPPIDRKNARAELIEALNAIAGS
jgi:hypothetical protein